MLYIQNIKDSANKIHYRNIHNNEYKYSFFKNFSNLE